MRVDTILLTIVEVGTVVARRLRGKLWWSVNRSTSICGGGIYPFRSTSSCASGNGGSSHGGSYSSCGGGHSSSCGGRSSSCGRGGSSGCGGC